MTTQGSRLKQLRRALNLSQEEFGAKLDISKQYMSNLEADRNLLNNEKLVLLLIDFNVNLNWLIGGYGGMFNPKCCRDDEIDEKFIYKVDKILKMRGLI